MRLEIIRHLWENFWKIQNWVKDCVRANGLISSWQHHGQVLIFETWRGSPGLQNCARDFEFLFHFQDMALNISFCKTERFHLFLKSGSENRNQTEYENPKHCYGHKVLMSNCTKFGRFPAIRSWDQFLRRNEERNLRNGQFPVKICIDNQQN